MDKQTNRQKGHYDKWIIIKQTHGLKKTKTLTHQVEPVPIYHRVINP
jgi:hypothetical protein